MPSSWQQFSLAHLRILSLAHLCRFWYGLPELSLETLSWKLASCAFSTCPRTFPYLSHLCPAGRISTVSFKLYALDHTIHSQWLTLAFSPSFLHFHRGYSEHSACFPSTITPSARVRSRTGRTSLPLNPCHRCRFSLTSCYHTGISLFHFQSPHGTMASTCMQRPLPLPTP